MRDGVGCGHAGFGKVLGDVLYGPCVVDAIFCVGFGMCEGAGDFIFEEQVLKGSFCGGIHEIGGFENGNIRFEYLVVAPGVGDDGFGYLIVGGIAEEVSDLQSGNGELENF